MELYHYVGIIAVLGIAYFVIAGRIRYANSKKKLPMAVYKLVSIIYPEGSRKAIIAKTVNANRRYLNLPELKTDSFLDKLAQRRCEELDRDNELSHYGVADEFSELRTHGVYKSAELIAGNYGTPTGVVKGWMDSKSHYMSLVAYRYDAFAVHSQWDKSEKRWIDVMLMIDIDKDLR